MWNTKNWTDNHCQHGVMNSNLTSHHGIPSEKHLIGITLVSNDPKHTANEEVSEGWPIRSTLA